MIVTGCVSFAAILNTTTHALARTCYPRKKLINYADFYRACTKSAFIEQKIVLYNVTNKIINSNMAMAIQEQILCTESNI